MPVTSYSSVLIGLGYFPSGKGFIVITPMCQATWQSISVEQEMQLLSVTLPIEMLHYTVLPVSALSFLSSFWAISLAFSCKIYFNVDLLQGKSCFENLFRDFYCYVYSKRTCPIHESRWGSIQLLTTLTTSTFYHEIAIPLFIYIINA